MEDLVPRGLFQRIQEITRELKPNALKIEDYNGKRITEIDEVIEIWSSYCRKLDKSINPTSTVNKLPSFEKMNQKLDILKYKAK